MSDSPSQETANKFYNIEAEAEQPKPTEEAEVTKQEIQEPEQEVEKTDKPEEIESKDDIKAEEPESEDENEESQYIELDGKEISLDEVRDGLNNGLMQKDYTKKTTEFARYKETETAKLDSDRENLLKSQTEVSEMKDMLNVLVAEDDAIDWAELKEDDPDRYIELKEKADSRKDALAKVKAERDTPIDDPALIAEEQGKLFKANPEWFDDKGKPTDTYTSDTKLMNDYAIQAGFTSDEFSQMTRAHYITTVLKAAKYDALQEKGREIKQKRETVPVVTKPKATKVTTKPKSMADTFYKTG